MKKNLVILASGFTLIMFAVVIYVAMSKRSNDLILIDEPIRAGAITLPAGKVGKTHLVDSMDDYTMFTTSQLELKVDSLLKVTKYNASLIDSFDLYANKTSYDKVKKVLLSKRDSLVLDNFVKEDLIGTYQLELYFQRKLEKEKTVEQEVPLSFDELVDSMDARKEWNEALIEALDDAILKQPNEKVRKALELKRDSVAFEHRSLSEQLREFRIIMTLID